MTQEQQCFLMNVNKMSTSNHPGSSQGENRDDKPLRLYLIPKEKVMSYEEKTVGSTAFFKCEACPFMAFAEDDIKFHLFTEHPDLAKSNGLADNIQIQCPGCCSTFDAEATLRTHLRNHHKMGIKDVRKMVKSLIQIALKNAKLKHEEPLRPLMNQPETADVKIPQVIEIIPDSVTPQDLLPRGVTFISVDELQKMRTPNLSQIDPKDIIEEASFNIVYNNVSSQFINVNEASTSTSSSCNILQIPSVPPDLISSIQHNAIDASNYNYKETKEQMQTNVKPGRPIGSRNNTSSDTKLGTCLINGCHVKLKDEDKLAYHRLCHQSNDLQCPECKVLFTSIGSLHTHLWLKHEKDMELPTCDICGYKAFKRSRVFGIHMKCHGDVKAYPCELCSKSFKNSSQRAKHRHLAHNKKEKDELNKCSICDLIFSNQRRLKTHVAAVHEKLRPFKCSHCTFTAARKEELKLHLRSHTGDKPYACDQCSYRSSDHNSMRRHKKKHTKESLYKCEYCPYTTIQSTVFTTHMIYKHPEVQDAVHLCPFCRFKSINKDNFVVHLSTHTESGARDLIDIVKSKMNKPSWTIPSGAVTSKEETVAEQKLETQTNLSNNPHIEVYDCDSQQDNLTQEYPKNYCTNKNNDNTTEFTSQVTVRDLSKDTGTCVDAAHSNVIQINNRQFTTQHLTPTTYESPQGNLRLLSSPNSIQQDIITNNSLNLMTTNLSPIRTSINNNIMANFPIRLPLSPQISVSNNITLKPADKISLPMNKVTGPMIKPTQILPVPSSSNSPVSSSSDTEGAPRKKPKISVKSNLVLKGPDQVNMFHSQQKLAFKRLEDNERFGLGSPVTFNNLITKQFMQLPPEPALSESPNNMLYPQETLLESSTPPVETDLPDTTQLFNYQQINVNSIPVIPPQEKIPTNDPSYIKLEATIKQNTQSPSLERMCNANAIINSQTLNREYKASPPLEEIHKNMSVIKNEVKSDGFYNIPINNTTNPVLLDQYLLDNLIGEQYNTHLDLPTTVLQEISDEQQSDVIEIDDNSDDNKLLPRFDMNNFHLESLYLMHNDFHFLENDIQVNTDAAVSEINRMVAEVPLIVQKDNVNLVPPDVSNVDFPNFIQGKKDPMMNTSVRQSTNKINVKNIELMKN